MLLAEMERIGADVIYTYPSVLLRIAHVIGDRGTRIRPRLLLAHGEILTEAVRQRVEQAFKAPLLHTYGCTELPRIGFECRHRNGFHLIPDAAVVEVIRDGRPTEPGEEGEIVLTPLRNRCMPLLRYRIEDRAAFSPEACPCGLPYPMLTTIVGRSDDFLILPSGRHVSARSVNCVDLPDVREYKIVQAAPDLIHVLTVPARALTPTRVNNIQARIASGCLGEKVEVRVTCVDRLALERTGKLRTVVREFDA